MRYAPAGVLLLLCLAVPAVGQTPRDLRVVKTAKAEVFPRPSTKDHYYVVNRLKKGDAVEVLKELPDGWLEIRPPAGSTSWISTLFLQPVSQNRTTLVVALEGTDVPVYPSPADPTPRRPEIEGVRLKRGHQVYALSKKVSDGQVTWQEIESPDNESRFIRADAVERASADVVRTSGAVPGGLQRSTAPSANDESAAEELRRQAVRADQAGNLAEAIRLYDRISAQYAAAYPVLARMSRARADYLRGELTDRSGQGGTAAPVRPASRQGGSSFAPDDRPAPRAAANGWQTYRGRLTPAHSRINDQRAYLLSLSQPAGAVTWVYVIAGPGVNLDALAGHSVELRGTLQYHSDNTIRANVLQATQAAPLD